MRWWLNTDAKRFSVDNAVVNGLDFSALPTDVWMIQWQDGKGEIERQFDKDTNDNGLRERIIDILPYCPYFQDFLEMVPYLTITQAKKVQVDLINEVYNSKRQMPYHYPVAAGDYWWDATDDTLYSSTAAGLQNTIASLNQVIDKLNTLVASINAIDATIVQGVNAQMGTINSGISAVGNVMIGQVNAMIGEINSDIVDATNNALNTADAYYADPGNALVGYINGVLLGTYGDGANNINNKLMMTIVGNVPSGETLTAIYAAPGLGSQNSPANIPASSVGFPHNPYRTFYIATIAPGTFNNVSTIASGGPIPWTNLGHVTVANAQWIPVGSTVPVNVTPTEQAAIMNGIAARTNDLNIKRNIKIGQVNALTTLSAVIAYDVTTGW